MPHSTRTPSFPANIEYYAPWVAAHGLTAPYGECQCGCGENAPIAKKTNNENGRRRGYPVRFIQGHNARPLDDAPEGFKTCAGCIKVKPLEEFYLFGTGRYASKCKECSTADVRAYHHANREERLAYSAEYQRVNKEQLAQREKERRADPEHRKKRNDHTRAWREKNRDHLAAYNAKRQREQREYMEEAKQKSIQKHPEREMARRAVGYAVSRGVFPPASTMVCEHCQEAQAKQYHHHKGYSEDFKLDVIALCTDCHGKAHWID